MSQEFSRSFYNSQTWKKCRKAFKSYRVAVDGGMCQLCHDDIGKIVHHKTELTPDNINDPTI